MSDEMLRHSPSFRPPDGRRAQTEQTVLHLGDTTLTGGELADRISQYFQAFEALGEGSGATVGLLSLNRGFVRVAP